jgi:hypothetical protein
MIVVVWEVNDIVTVVVWEQKLKNLKFEGFVPFPPILIWNINEVIETTVF